MSCRVEGLAYASRRRQAAAAAAEAAAAQALAQQHGDATLSPQKQQQPSKQPGPPEAAEGDVTVSTFSQSDKNMHVTVEKPERGFMCTLSMFARVPLDPDRLYSLLVDPDECKRVFKSLKRVHQRRVLEQDGQGNRIVEVDQTGSWRFLMFRGTFTVRMIVEQRRQDRTIHFRLARPGFMRDFSGTWRIAPFDNASLDELVNHHRPTALHRLQSGLRAAERRLGGLLGGGSSSGGSPQSLVQLQQSIMPALVPPAPVARVLQRIAAKQITSIMTDLQTEAERLNSAVAAAATTGSGDSGSSRSEAQATEVSKKSSKKQRKEREAAAAGQGQQEVLDKKQLAAHVRALR